MGENYDYNSVKIKNIHIGKNVVIVNFGECYTLDNIDNLPSGNYNTKSYTEKYLKDLELKHINGKIISAVKLPDVKEILYVVSTRESKCPIFFVTLSGLSLDSISA